MNDVVLHVGMPRSTAVLAPALLRLRSQLRRRGVTALLARDLDRLPHACAWAADRSAPPRQGEAFADELATLLAAERSRVLGAGPVLISHDGLLGRDAIGLVDAVRFRPYAARAVRHVLGAVAARSVRIVLYTERQDRLMELAHLGRIRAGGSDSLAEVYPSRFEPVLDYCSLTAELEDIAGVDEVVVRPVELADAGVHAFVADFLDATGLEPRRYDLTVLGHDLPTHPTTYSQRGAAIALALRPLVAGDEMGLVRRFVIDHHSTGDVPVADLFTRDDRARVVSAYAAANRALFEQRMPDLPADSYSSDAALFGLGNVLAQPRMTSHRVRRPALAVGTAILTGPRRARFVAGRLAVPARRTWAALRGRRRGVS